MHSCKIEKCAQNNSFLFNDDRLKVKYAKLYPKQKWQILCNLNKTIYSQNTTALYWFVCSLKTYLFCLIVGTFDYMPLLLIEWFNYITLFCCVHCNCLWQNNQTVYRSLGLGLKLQSFGLEKSLVYISASATATVIIQPDNKQTH